MTDLKPLSAEELAETRGLVWPRGEGEGWCNLCGFGWPCRCAALLATIAAQSSELEQLRAENVILKDGRCTNCMEPVNPLHLKCACVRAEIDQTSFWLEEENTRLRTALEAQRSDEGYQAWLREKYRETAATIAQQTETIRGLKTALLTALHAVHDLSNLKPHTKHGRWQDCPDAVCRGGAAALTSTEAKDD